MSELLPQPKGNEEQILALMAALGQHLVPDYLKNRDVPIPMTPEGLLAPNPAGKVPQLNPSALETGTMAGLDLASMMVPIGGAVKPFVAAGVGAPAKPGLSGLLKQLAAQTKKAVQPSENLVARTEYTTSVPPKDELEAAFDSIMQALKWDEPATKATKPLLTEAADIGFSPTSGNAIHAVVNGSPAGKIHPTLVSGKFHASLDSPTGPKSLGTFASQQEAQDTIKAELIGKPWPYKGASTQPGLSDAEVEASLAENPGASIFDVAGVKQPGAVADKKAADIAAVAERTFKDIPITPLDWVSALGTRHAADVTLGKSPEELAALGFNPNLPLFKGGKPFYKEELPDPAAKVYEKALFFADNPNVAQRYGDVLPFVARATKAGEVDWKKVSGGFPHYDEPTMSAIIEAGRAQGYDLLKIKKLLDIGGMQDQYAVLHPNLLRAPTAQFDPAKLHLNNVLAGLAGAAVVPPMLKETDLLNGLRWNQ